MKNFACLLFCSVFAIAAAGNKITLKDAPPFFEECRSHYPVGTDELTKALNEFRLPETDDENIHCLTLCYLIGVELISSDGMWKLDNFYKAVKGDDHKALIKCNEENIKHEPNQKVSCAQAYKWSTCVVNKLPVFELHRKQQMA